MNSFLSGLIIGLLVGAGFVYWIFRRTLNEQKQELKQTKRTITNLTRAHELQLQDTIASLQRDHQRQLKTASLAQQPETQSTQESVAPPNPAPQPEPVLTPSISALTEPLVVASEASPIAPDLSVSEPAVKAPPPSLLPIADPWIDPVPPHPGSFAAPEPDSETREPVLSPDAVDAAAPVAVSVAAVSADFPTTPTHSYDLVAALGQSGGALSQILNYHNASDATLRQQVAIALGQRFRGQPIRPGDQSVIATLSVLCRDSNPGVRKAAVEALGTVKSAAAIPALQRALRDTDVGVVKAASLAIAQFKHYPVPQTKSANPKRVKR